MVRHVTRIAASVLPVAAALALLMGLTRLGHFSELSRLPDASWAVFFLGGLLLRDARLFVAFLGLAWAVDIAAVALGTPADCFSIGYAFLVPASAALWWSGRASSAAWAQHGWRAAGGLLGRLGLGVVAAFIVSNIGFHLFGAEGNALSTREYAVAVMGYLPGYLLVAACWVCVALAAPEALRYARGSRAVR